LKKKSQQIVEILKSRLRNLPEAAPGKTLVCCVSGGADSVALFFCLCRLCPALGFHLAVCHVNHGIRGKEANRDEAFVKKMCEKENVPCYVKRLDFKKGDKVSEEDLRRERFRAILECARETGACAAVLAHHKDDLVETFLMRLVKGAGIRGLAGFQEYSVFRGLPLLRPFKNISRKTIIDFLRLNRIRWREDRTNKDPAYLRNKFRNELIPLLENEYNPGIKNTLFHSSEQFSLLYEYIRTEALQAWEESIHCTKGFQPELQWILLEDIAALSDYLLTEILRLWIMKLGGSHIPPRSCGIESLLGMIRKTKSGTLLRLAENIVAYKDYERIILFKSSLERNAPKSALLKEATKPLLFVQNSSLRHPFFHKPGVYIEIGKKDIPKTGKKKILRAKNLKFTLYTAQKRLKKGEQSWIVPLKNIRFPLALSTREGKERLRIRGQTKSLKKWFEENRIPRPLRDHIVLLKGAGGMLLYAGKAPFDPAAPPSPPFMVLKWQKI